MAHQLRTQLHALHSDLESMSFASSASPNMLDSRLSWSSMEDTDSDSDREGASCQSMRRKTTRKMTSTTRRNSAMPLPIPARTHDFGWCDRDDMREARDNCACGVDCDDFFHGDDEHTHAFPSSMQNTPASSDEDDMIFDMEM
ncbi:hypothetical protein P43SY_001748 [Pythium insidiosum]|uniref:Uncharacterized protein n=1 Tax=Pythium insidiosum TaxID=114742 RepID=A0AAD5M6Z8_PYTIN|nr:hypothetical protein P43SY_001748 [Pythium insidiosum]